jgi:hypothetical protein
VGGICLVVRDAISFPSPSGGGALWQTDYPGSQGVLSPDRRGLLGAAAGGELGLARAPREESFPHGVAVDGVKSRMFGAHPSGRRLTFVPGDLTNLLHGLEGQEQGCLPHRPSRKEEAWNQKVRNDLIAKEIKNHLFNWSPRSEVDKLALAVDHLELTMNRFSPNCQDKIEDDPGEKDQGVSGVGEMEEDSLGGGGRNGPTHSEIYAHSWRPSGPGWLWLPKSATDLNLGFPARVEEIRRLGHFARRVHRLPPPPPLQ